MHERCSAVLVYDKEEPLGGLEVALRQQYVKTCRAKSCQEAWRLLDRAGPPHLVFTDITLPDGTWEDVLGIATKAPEAVNVIVVARFLDIQLYFETMERGACDFVIPPFLAADLNHIVVCAMEGVVSRRSGPAYAA